MIEVTWETLPLILLTIATAALGTARLTRLVVFDDFPPVAWWRDHWEAWFDGSDWRLLFNCWWCFGFWAAALCVGTFIAALFVPWIGWAWWIFWGSLALGYLAPMIVVRDGQD